MQLVDTVVRKKENCYIFRTVISNNNLFIFYSIFYFFSNNHANFSVVVVFGR